MPKRFTSTEIWDEDWFLDMPDNYKLFWYYMLSKCDHAGIFRVNLTKFNKMVNDKKKVLPHTAILHFNKGKNRIRILAENKWFIEDYFVFQYGSTLNRNSKVHESIENLYNQSDIKLTSIKGLKDLKDRVIDKDKDKEKKKGGSGENKSLQGEKFDEEFSYVYFPDGTKQKLGEQQKELAIKGHTKPKMIYQGSIY